MKKFDRLPPPTDAEARAELTRERERLRHIEDERLQQMREHPPTTLADKHRALPGISTVTDAARYLDSRIESAAADLKQALDDEGLADEYPVVLPDILRLRRAVPRALRTVRFNPALTVDELGALVTDLVTYIHKTLDAYGQDARHADARAFAYARDHVHQWRDYARRRSSAQEFLDPVAAALLHGDATEARAAMGLGPSYAEHHVDADGLHHFTYDPGPPET